MNQWVLGTDSQPNTSDVPKGRNIVKFLHVSINIVPVVENQSISRETQLIWSSSVESGTPHLLIPGMEGVLAHRHEAQPHIL